MQKAYIDLGELVANDDAAWGMLEKTLLMTVKKDHHATSIPVFRIDTRSRVLWVHGGAVPHIASILGWQLTEQQVLNIRKTLLDERSIPGVFSEERLYNLEKRLKLLENLKLEENGSLEKDLIGMEMEMLHFHIKVCRDFLHGVSERHLLQPVSTR